MAYAFKVWDKKEDINGCPAEVALEGNYQLIKDDVFLIYDDENPYRIMYMEAYHGPYYKNGMSIEEVAQSYIDRLNNPPEPQENIETENVRTVEFTDEQMEVINQLLQQKEEQTVLSTIEQMTDLIMAQLKNDASE